jgi:hypothetical protein
MTGDRRVRRCHRAWAARVVAGLISRAGHGLTAVDVATVLCALGDAAAYCKSRAIERCPACDGAPDGLCSNHDGDLERAAGYETLRRRLGGAR